MSQLLHPPQPVKLIVGMLSQSRELLTAAQSSMQTLWSAIDIVSDVMDFSQTVYYEKEMGTNLLRQFVAFAQLIDPLELAVIKHASNALETQLARSPAGQALGVPRSINLDPGYINLSKLVLATTKDYSHRIYIGQSMYAEATLHFHKGQWQSWPYTYPDYAGGMYHPFLNAAREKYKEDLSWQRTNP